MFTLIFSHKLGSGKLTALQIDVWMFFTAPLVMRKYVTAIFCNKSKTIPLKALWAIILPLKCCIASDGNEGTPHCRTKKLLTLYSSWSLQQVHRSYTGKGPSYLKRAPEMLTRTLTYRTPSTDNSMTRTTDRSPRKRQHGPEQGCHS